MLRTTDVAFTTALGDELFFEVLAAVMVGGDSPGNPIPEPSAALVFLLGLLVTGVARSGAGARRRRAS